MSEGKTIHIESNITDRMFGRFAMYDTFVRKKAWRSPLLFALLMTGFALLCFFAGRGREQSGLLGTVLLSVGLVLPAVWLLMYIFSVRNQIKKFGLSRFKTQYTLDLDSSGIHVSKDKEKADFTWESVDSLVLDKGCAYLYVSRTRAFLLPEGESCTAAAELAESILPRGKIIRRR